MKHSKPTYKLVKCSDDIIENVTLALTDATLPINKLKRVAKRTCLQCQETYKSDVSMLCDDGFCSQACKDKWEQLAQELKQHVKQIIKGVNNTVELSEQG